jgi:hypothetical protein
MNTHYLPDLVLENIFHHLDQPRDLSKVSQICKSWYNELLWKTICESKGIRNPYNDSWKKCYKLTISKDNGFYSLHTYLFKEKEMFKSDYPYCTEWTTFEKDQLGIIFGELTKPDDKKIKVYHDQLKREGYRILQIANLITGEIKTIYPKEFDKTKNNLQKISYPHVALVQIDSENHSILKVFHWKTGKHYQKEMPLKSLNNRSIMLLNFEGQTIVHHMADQLLFMTWMLESDKVQFNEQLNPQNISINAIWSMAQVFVFISDNSTSGDRQIGYIDKKTKITHVLAKRSDFYFDFGLKKSYRSVSCDQGIVAAISTTGQLKVWDLNKTDKEGPLIDVNEAFQPHLYTYTNSNGGRTHSCAFHQVMVFDQWIIIAYIKSDKHPLKNLDTAKPESEIQLWSIKKKEKLYTKSFDGLLSQVYVNKTKIVLEFTEEEQKKLIKILNFDGKPFWLHENFFQFLDVKAEDAQSCQS